MSGIIWCDLPVIQLERAIAFYEAVLGCTIVQTGWSGRIGVMRPQYSSGPNVQQPLIGCAFFEITDDERTSLKMESPMPLLYFGCEGRLDHAVELVTKYRGEVITPPAIIAPFGRRAIVRDSEGNRIGLSSQS